MLGISRGILESMYAIDDDNSFTLPPNLYIIGTMNTADRSVGHIDYAIRRRFAFVNVLPKELEGNFDKNLFKAVSKVFLLRTMMNILTIQILN